MYDEGGNLGLVEGPLVPAFNLSSITAPIALFLGGKDTLVDNDWTKAHLPKHVQTFDIPDYEHLDFLWGHNIDTTIFPSILDLLSSHQKSTIKKV